ncbi:MAG TPA: hypothetical protein DEA80_16345 [Afipia sp.]|nr:hypothetical protein [Afipia sp.]OUX62334.1 MAG: hypothetical protein CBB64_04300 [Afipia sp. TMED4]HBF53328.1 hypothetical protein [Afipia sp.]HBR46464.1 hypothetical protein [Afipia sp.]HCX19058.1 hypothetical protein [Afipia sp.]|tara:strand:+ start:531 stop:1160 length:630 start_codon:yes stop_codon:yes gene_type:complete
MKEPVNRIAQIRKQRGLSQQDLADAIGSHWVTISKLERGKLPLTPEWSEKISAALKVDDMALMLPKSLKARIFVDTVVLEGRSRGLVSREPLPLDLGTGTGSTGDALWALVGDASLYPFFQAGDVLRLVVQIEDPSLFIGRLCLIRPSHEARHHIGFLEPGTDTGHFTIRRLNGPPIANIEIEVIAVVERAIYQPSLTKELRDELGQSS